MDEADDDDDDVEREAREGGHNEDKVVNVESCSQRLIRDAKRIKAMMPRLANRRKRRDFFGKWMKKGRQITETREP